MPRLGVFHMIVRATAMTLQTTSWVFSFWLPLLALLVFFKVVYLGEAHLGSNLAAIVTLAAGSLMVAWVLSRTAHWLLDGSRIAAMMLGVVLTAGALALVLPARTSGDRVEETMRYVWAGVAVAWSGALVAAAGRRDRLGERAGR